MGSGALPSEKVRIGRHRHDDVAAEAMKVGVRGTALDHSLELAQSRVAGERPGHVRGSALELQVRLAVQLVRFHVAHRRVAVGALVLGVQENAVGGHDLAAANLHAIADAHVPGRNVFPPRRPKAGHRAAVHLVVRNVPAPVLDGGEDAVEANHSRQRDGRGRHPARDADCADGLEDADEQKVRVGQPLELVEQEARNKVQRGVHTGANLVVGEELAIVERSPVACRMGPCLAVIREPLAGVVTARQTRACLLQKP
mmetsp:Transcript_2711/g.10875  ORF Transcript_2711/g.10875 Transcript_2711/m.10875 type:complete len:256 (-) Transcript_2711:160-927(-)